jgi:hypothetical protein
MYFGILLIIVQDSLRIVLECLRNREIMYLNVMHSVSAGQKDARGRWPVSTCVQTSDARPTITMVASKMKDSSADGVRYSSAKSLCMI